MKSPSLEAKRQQQQLIEGYWRQVERISQLQQNAQYLGKWFRHSSGFKGLCVVDRGQGSSRLLELRNHKGRVCVATVASVVTIDEPANLEEMPPKPVNLGEPEVGDRVTWAGAPSWWNRNGERLVEINGGCGIVEYWRSPVPYQELRVVIKALTPQETWEVAA